jgi:ribosomal protein S18 acetylase RimI-like enzyme
VGLPPDPFEEWAGNEVEAVAAGDEAVGALSGVVWGERSWVGELGVLARWRGRGIASALLRRAFATFASRQLPRVMLNVDSRTQAAQSGSTSGWGCTARAWDLYEKRVV